MNRREWIERAQSIKALGFSRYLDYLRSDLWRDIRRLVLARDRRTCGCNRMANQVHHRRYDIATMKGDALENLVSICNECHRKGSVYLDRVVTPHVANARIGAIQSKGPKLRTARQRRQAWRYPEARLQLATEKAKHEEGSGPKPDPLVMARIPAKRL